MENNLEIGIQELLGKLKNRIAEDAQSIAMLEATVDVYKSKIIEMQKRLAILEQMQSQE